MNFTWPTLLKTVDDDELIYYQDLDSFKRYVDTEILPPTTDDQFIDIHGNIFQLTRSINDSKKSFVWQYKSTLELHYVNELLQRHHSAHGECCVAKLVFKTAKEAIRSLS